MMQKLILVISFFITMFMPLFSPAFSFFSNDKSTGLAGIAEGAIGPYEDHSAEYGNSKNSGDGYINILCLNIGNVSEDMNSSLEEMVAEDRAKTEGTYLGQFNIINQTFSYCGLNGAVWGYHLAKAQTIIDIHRYKELKNKGDKINNSESEELQRLEGSVLPLLMVKRDDGFEVPVYNGDTLIDAGRRLLGINDNKRFTILPGAEVKCAEKKYISSGPKYIWAAIAFCVAEDREVNANLFIENAGELVARDKEDIKDFEKKINTDLSHAAIRLGKDNNIQFSEIWVSTQIKWIPKGRTGCAMAIVPYITLAKKAIPEKGAVELVKISLNEWEKDLKLSPVPEYKSNKNDFTTEYINFETRDIEKRTSSSTAILKKTDKKNVDPNDWTPLQIGFFKEHYPSAEEYPNIYGIRLGLPITYNDNSCLYGIDLSAFFSATTLVKGLQFTVVGNQAKDIDGMQISIANFAKENLNGIQLGGVNYAEQAQGVQLGLVNYAKKSQGIQIGLVNIIADGWLPFSIIFNLNF